MARIEWNSAGERFYETGIDQAVLYVEGLAPTPWNGLLSVSELAVGGESIGYHYNGVKYLDSPNNQEFKATIRSYYTPDIFNECDGLKQLTYYGLFATQQTRKTFNFCYKTAVGNDLDGVDHAYKLHLVYNAIAAPLTRDYKSLDNNADPAIQSWSITAVPPAVTGFKPTPYRVIDSRKYSTAVMTSIENVLYGTVSQSPRFPTQDELTTLLGA